MMNEHNGTGGFMRMSASNKIGDNPRLAELLTKVNIPPMVSKKSEPVTPQVRENLEVVYTNRYGKPESDLEAITKLGDIFSELMGGISEEDKDGIGEYYRILLNRGLPAYEWLLESFHVASKKDDNKRNFRYAVGMIRSWMKFGFGHIPSQEEEDVVAYFEEVTGMYVPSNTRLMLQNLIGIYGVIKVTRMIAKLENEKDLASMMAYVLKATLEDKYPDAESKMVASIS